MMFLKNLFKKSMKTSIPTLLVDSEACITELCELGRRFGTDKSPINGFGHRHGYTPIYDFLFSALKYRAIKLAEIGIGSGASLRMFRTYFPNAKLYGIDVNPEHIKSCCEDPKLSNTQYAIADVEKPATLRDCFAGFDAQFDIIMDDSSHVQEHQLNVIRECFPFLTTGGILVVEDIYDHSGMAPEELFAKEIDKIRNQVGFCSFVIPKNTRINTDDWNNEKLLFIVKGLA